MRGHFSRRTFDAKKHLSAVLVEQGSLLTDADLEEEHRILIHRIESEAADLIGGCGGPLDDAGFEISGGNPLTIGKGTYYVDGVRVHNETDGLDYLQQPDRYISAYPTARGRYVAVLDVWHRLITALDDPSIREVALGGPTTSVRERTVWQVRLVKAPNNWTCGRPLPDLGPTTGTLAARAEPAAAATSPCLIPANAGFSGLENQFYRVEIHDSGQALDLSNIPAVDLFVVTGIPAQQANQVTLQSTGAQPDKLQVGQAIELFKTGADPMDVFFAHVAAINGTTVTLTADLPAYTNAEVAVLKLRRVHATCVFSRDNGSVVTEIRAINGNEITVASLGPDDVLGFAPGQWVEITDDALELEGTPGQLLRIAAIDVAASKITLTTSATALAAPADGTGIDRTRSPKLRRWEGAAAVKTNAPTPPAHPDGDWMHLENGIQVRFDAGFYRTADYWHFPARTAIIDPASGTIEWPRDANGPELRLPHGIKHHYCPLAALDLLAPGGVFAFVSDCRNLFPPVTALTNLLYVGGDGQTAELPGLALAAPLEVRVVNGDRPVQDAQVEFATSTGTLAGNGQMVVVTTDAEGLASCNWTLGPPVPNNNHQLCTATLRDAAQNNIANQVVHFNASVLLASNVSYDPANCRDMSEARVTTVQGAIDFLCNAPGHDECCIVVKSPEELQKVLVQHSEESDGRESLCICLLPGRYELKLLPPFASLTISGRRGKRDEDDPPKSTTIIQSAPIEASGFGTLALNDLELVGEGGEDLLRVSNTDRLIIRGCLLEKHGGATGDAVLTIGNGVGEVRIIDCDIIYPTIETAIADHLPNPVGTLVTNVAEGNANAVDVATTIANTNTTPRRALATRTANAVDANVGNLIDATARANVDTLLTTIRGDNPTPDAILTAARDVAPIRVRSGQGVAIQFLDGNSRSWLERNTIEGSVNLYGSGELPINTDSDGYIAQLRTILGALTRAPAKGGDLRLNENSLQNIVLGRPTADIAGKGSAFRSLVLTGNTLNSAPHAVLARSVTFSSNAFQNPSPRVVGYIIADVATFAGNTADLPEASLQVATNTPPGDAANVRLTISAT